jgi:hypothetical protein
LRTQEIFLDSEERREARVQYATEAFFASSQADAKEASPEKVQVNSKATPSLLRSCSSCIRRLPHIQLLFHGVA